VEYLGGGKTREELELTRVVDRRVLREHARSRGARELTCEGVSCVRDEVWRRMERDTASAASATT
jgi:hypothetical protein